MNAFLGIDVGTSGVRACVIDGAEQQLVTHALPLPDARQVESGGREQEAEIWWQAIVALITATVKKLTALKADTNITHIAINGTSATILLVDDRGEPLTPALMYNDSRCRAQAAQIRECAPENSAAHGRTSALAKALYLAGKTPAAQHIVTQADWIAGKLCQRFDCSDENNVLKLGYDVVDRAWPAWINELGTVKQLLPQQVSQPGQTRATIQADIARQLGLCEEVRIVSGTTDSVAAFIATGASEPGDAVTSLGSTLVLKLVSSSPLFAPQFGIYSHRLGNTWLAGGASNSGGRVLLDYFDIKQIRSMSQQINPRDLTGLMYYPLSAKGERFPCADADKPPQLSPRPDNDVTFFQAMLEGISRIEQQGYAKLGELGASTLTSIRTVGGGSSNAAWTKLRASLIGVPMREAAHTQASYGSALLARRADSCRSD